MTWRTKSQHHPMDVALDQVWEGMGKEATPFNKVRRHEKVNNTKLNGTGEQDRVSERWKWIGG